MNCYCGDSTCGRYRAHANQGGNVIPELFKSVTGSVLRWVLQGFFAWLAAKNIITEQQGTELLLAITGGVIVLVWSLVQKYKSRLAFLTALNMPAGTPEEMVKTAIRSGHRDSVWSLLLLVSLIPLVGLQTACGDDTVRGIAVNVDRVAILVQDGREVRDELFAQTVIDRDEAYKFTLALQKVHNANKTFKVKAETYQAGGGLTPEGKQDLAKLSRDISDAVTELVSNGTFGVKNPDAQARINAVIGSIRQAALAIVDSVNQLKTKKPADTAMVVEQIPIDYSGFTPLALVPLLILTLRQIVGFVNAERDRTGKTTEEIFEEAGVKIEALDAGFIEDLIKYGPPEE